MDESDKIYEKKGKVDILLFISVTPFFCLKLFVPAADKDDI